MTKLDVNTATKEDLVQAVGLRPPLAEAIVRYREARGRLAEIETLRSVAGVGAATLDLLRARCEVVAESVAAAAAGAGAGMDGAAAEAVAVIDRAADVSRDMTRLAETATGAAASSMARAGARRERASAAAGAMFPPGFGVEEVVRLCRRAARAQQDDGIDTLKALVSARDLRDVVALQSGFLGRSVERGVRFSAGYAGIVGAWMSPDRPRESR